MYSVLSLLKFPGPECAISSFSEYILCAKTRFHLEVTMAERERPANVTVWVRVRILGLSLDWFEFLQYLVA